MTYVGPVVNHAGMNVFRITSLTLGMMMTLYGIVYIWDHVIGCGGYDGVERSLDDHICKIQPIYGVDWRPRIGHDMQ